MNQIGKNISKKTHSMYISNTEHGKWFLGNEASSTGGGI